MRRVVLALCLFAAPLAAAPKKASKGPPILSKTQVEGLMTLYKRSKGWAMRGLVLLSLGRYWHPSGVALVEHSLKSPDIRLRVFAVEALARTAKKHIKHVATAEVLDLLIGKELALGHKHYRKRILEVAGRALPGFKGMSVAECRKHWQGIRDGWQVAPFKEPDVTVQQEAKSVATPFIRRVMDLNQNGLELALCIDSTGSMQHTIDAARDALARIVEVLGQVSPDLKVGLVHYRDYGDFDEGAQRLVTLTPRHGKVRGKLAKLRAEGGGDIPERVEKGLQKALHRKMGWKKSTNKLVVIIGDAPLHELAMPAALKWARLANTKPKEALHQGQVTSGSGRSKKPVRPFVVSTIAVSRGAADHFKQIAKAGGGTYAALNFRRGKGAATRAARRVVTQILILAFGARWEKEVRRFLAVLDAYRDGKIFK